jgi:hypothetical protein
MDAPSTGGFVPGGRIFAVDGNHEEWDPHGAPEISNPFEGDSVFSNRDVIYLGPPGSGANWHNNQIYVRVALNEWPNLQPWFPNQDSIVIEQRFRGSFSSFQAMRLNTPYNPNWALPWRGQFLGGEPSVPLSDAILVKEEGPKDIGGGLGEVYRRFASVPKTRSIVEEFTYNYIGLSDPTGGETVRPRIAQTVFSRLQYDFFVFDDFPVLATPLFPAGNRLDSTTGLYPPGMILNAQKYYGASAYSEVDTLFDDDGTGLTQTNPSLTEYLAFLDQTDSGGPAAAELIAQSSRPQPWMGNIYVRITRYVEAR